MYLNSYILQLLEQLERRLIMLKKEEMGLIIQLPETCNVNKHIFIGAWECELYRKLVDEIVEKIGNSISTVSMDKSNDYSVLKVEKGYEIVDVEDELYIYASNSEMLYVALTKVLYGEKKDNYTESYRFPTRTEYINNPQAFVTVWQYLWTPPKWLLDYEEKKNTFSRGVRPMCWAHRGGGDYYPENSIETIISSIKMGADIMELDFRYTKDKKIILMHYDTLYQSTDWEDKHGKNGLPDSDKIEDWTYEQLQQLNLKAGQVFSSNCSEGDEPITEYKIPLLEEVLKVCNKKVFFVMDKMKPYEEWEAVYALMQETGCFEAFAFAYDFPIDEYDRIQAEIKRDFGSCGPYFYLRTHAGSLEREMLSCEERLNVFDEFSEKYNNAAIMTNYVKDLVTYIDRKGEKADEV